MSRDLEKTWADANAPFPAGYSLGYSEEGLLLLVLLLLSVVSACVFPRDVSLDGVVDVAFKVLSLLLATVGYYVTIGAEGRLLVGYEVAAGEAVVAVVVAFEAAICLACKFFFILKLIMLFVTFLGGSSFAVSGNLASAAAGGITTAGAAVLSAEAGADYVYCCCCCYWTSIDEDVARLLMLFWVELGMDSF